MGNSYLLSALKTHARPPCRGHEWERVTDVHINSQFHEKTEAKGLG